MKLVSWNVNGIRSLKKSFKDTLEDLGADLICLQETKANRSTLEDNIINIPGYSSYFSFPKYQNGYSGVATFCRNEIRPICAEEGLTGELIEAQHRADAVGQWPNHPDVSSQELKALETEGRALVTKHVIRHKDQVKNIAVINVYCPRVDCLKPERAVFQLNFFKLLQRRAEELLKNGCGVFIAGDINAARHPIDSCEPGDPNEFSNRPSRQWLNGFLQPVNGTQGKEYFIDTFRYFYPDKPYMYTCWSSVTSARKTNYGTRIDYILVDKDTIHLVENSLILSDFDGSDHCPVGVLVNCQMVSAQKCPSICSKYWPEFSGKQRKLTNFTRVEEVEPVLDIQSTAKKQKRDNSNKQLSITRFLNNHQHLKNPQENTEELLRPEKQSIEFFDGCTEKEITSTNNYSDHLSQNKRSSQVSAWKLMLKGPPKPPKCSGHNEICLLRTVQKEGPNYGKQFFVCPRPIGDKTNKDARCGFFKWT